MFDPYTRLDDLIPGDVLIPDPGRGWNEIENEAWVVVSALSVEYEKLAELIPAEAFQANTSFSHKPFIVTFLTNTGSIVYGVLERAQHLTPDLFESFFERDGSHMKNFSQIRFDPAEPAKKNLHSSMLKKLRQTVQITHD